MKKFAVQIHGVNFHIRDLDSAEAALMGFYINAFVEADTANLAEMQAIELVRASSKLRPKVANSSDDPPRLFVEEIAELSEWPDDCSRPLSGFIFYDDPDADWRNQHKDP